MGGCPGPVESSCWMILRSHLWMLHLLLVGCGGVKILEVDGFKTTQQEYDSMLQAVRPAASFVWT